MAVVRFLPKLSHFQFYIMYKLLRVGADCHLNNCRAEGYLTVQFPAKMNQDNVPNDQSLIFGKIRPTFEEGEKYHFLTYSTPMDVFGQYLSRKQSIDNFADCNYLECPTNIYDILNLADRVDMYCGLD